MNSVCVEVFQGIDEANRNRETLLSQNTFPFFISRTTNSFFFFALCKFWIIFRFCQLTSCWKYLLFFWGNINWIRFLILQFLFFYNAKCNSLTHFEAAHTTQRNRIIIQMICMWFYTFCTVVGECWIIKHTKQLCVLFFPRALMCWYLIAFPATPLRLRGRGGATRNYSC